MDSNSLIDEDLKCSLDHLRNHRKAYDAFSKKLEVRFMKTGDSIESFMVNSMELMGNCDKLYNMAIGSNEETPIDVAMDVVMRLLDYVGDFNSKIDSLIGDAEQCHKLLLPLLEYEGNLVRIFKPLKFARSLFLMESASLAENRKEIFISLANEIAVMHQKVTELSSNEFSKFREVGVSIERIATQLKQEVAKLQDFVAQRRSIIEEFIADIKEDLEVNKNTNVALNSVSKVISADVQDIVTVIQNEDIAGQKLEHVIEAADSINEKMDTLVAVDPASANKKDVANVVIQAKVQIAQLNSITSDFKKTRDVINEKSTSIEDKVSELDKECLALQEFKVLTTSADGIVESLISNLEDSLGMLKAGTDEADKVYNEVIEFKGISSNITNTLKGLSRTLRLVVLNAQLKAAQVGKGTGLEVLASNVCSISDESQGLSVNIANELEKTAGEISKLVDSFNTLAVTGREEQNRYDGEVGTSKTELHSYRDGALNIMLELGAQADAIMQDASSLNESFQGDYSADEYFSEFSACFEEVIDEIRKVYGDDIEQYAQREFDEDSEGAPKYTMQEEWDIHKQIVTGEDVEIKSATESDGTVDFFDDFGDAPAAAPEAAPPPVAAPPLAAAPTPAPADDNIDLFGDSEGDGGQGSGADDNIDLFGDDEPLASAAESEPAPAAPEAKDDVPGFDELFSDSPAPAAAEQATEAANVDLFDTAPAAAPTSPEPAAAEPEIAGVDLFGDDTPAAPAQPAADDIAGVDLFDDTPVAEENSPAPEPEKKKEEEKNLGDNIDLF